MRCPECGAYCEYEDWDWTGGDDEDGFYYCPECGWEEDWDE